MKKEEKINMASENYRLYMSSDYGYQKLYEGNIEGVIKTLKRGIYNKFLVIKHDFATNSDTPYFLGFDNHDFLELQNRIINEQPVIKLKKKDKKRSKPDIY